MVGRTINMAHMISAELRTTSTSGEGGKHCSSYEGGDE